MKSVVIGSFLLGILHSILFYDQGIGISVLLFSIGAIATFLLVLKKKERIVNKKALGLAVPIVLLSATYMFFRNELFGFLNAFVILILFAILLLFLTNEQVKLRHIVAKIGSLLIGSLEFIGEAGKLVKTSIKEKKEEGENFKTKKLVKGILIAIPLVLVILWLLISADPAFAQMFAGITKVIEAIFTSEFIFSLFFRTILIFILGFYFITVFYNLLAENTDLNAIEKVKKTRAIKVEPMTINVILTSLNSIYLLFSIAQLVVLFGEGMTKGYAQYARTGFAQLMVVSFINLVVILFTVINQKKGTQKEIQYTKIMNLVILGFTMILIGSAFYRMYQYEQQYGYTITRIMVYFVLITEAICLIPTVLYILKKKVSLIKTYFGIALAMYILLNYINVDAIMVKRNFEVYKRTGKFDYSYIKKDTGIDAVPELIQILKMDQDLFVQKEGNKTTDLKKELTNHLKRIEKELQKEKESLQSFNFSSWRAKKGLEGLNLQEQTTTQNKTKEIYY